MPRYQCFNCEHIVGALRPDECPVCRTAVFTDVEPLDDPQHPQNVRRDSWILLLKGVALLVFGAVAAVGFYLNHGPIGASIGIVPLVGGIVNLAIGYVWLAKLRAEEAN